MKHPPFRVVPASPAQRAADGDAPLIAFTTLDLEPLRLATAELGLGIDLADGVARMVLTTAQLGRLARDLHERGAKAFPAAATRFLQPVPAWRLRGHELALDRPYVMGILNLTDDSFSGDGVGRDPLTALRRGAELREAGADIIDVGAETARADRPVVDAVTEASLVAPVVQALVRDGHVVSVDTYKGHVARAALAAGAHLINDISGLTQGSDAASEAAAARAGYVLNYSYSVPKRRPDAPPRYADVVVETLAWMYDHLDALRAIGLKDEAIAIDPGIAFGKSHDEDLQVLRRAGEFHSLGLPLLLAHSRKNFIGSVSGRSPIGRDLETHVVTAEARLQGVQIFRVHDVAGTRRAVAMADALVAPAGRYAPDATSWPWAAGASAAHMTNASPDKPAPSGQRW